MDRRRGALCSGSLLRKAAIVFGCVPVVASCFSAAESSADELFDPAAQDPIARYLTAPSPGVAREEESLVILEEALRRWRSGDRAAAALDVDRALGELPALADWRPLIVAELLLATGDTAAVRARLDRLDPLTDYMGRWGWQLLVQSLERATDFPRAELVAAAAARGETEPARRSAKWLFAGRMALARGDSTAARSHFLQALREGEEYAGARDAARLIDRFSFAVTPEEDRAVARALSAAGAWERAEARISPWLSDEGIPSAEREELRLIAGRSLVELGRYHEAEEMLAPLVREPEASFTALTALSLSGRSALARNDVATAASHFRTLASRAPDSPLAGEALSLLLTRELETGFGPRSRAYLDQLLGVAIHTPDIEMLVVRLGTTFYMSGEYAVAARTFDRLAEQSVRPAARQQASYWSGLAREKGGDLRLAADRWAAVYDAEPLSFYGILAAERIDAPLLAADLRPGPDVRAVRQGEIHNAILRLRVHRQVPTTGSFNYELDRLTRYFSSSDDGGYEFAEGLIEGGFPLQGAVLGRELVEDVGEWNLRLLRIVHPFPHREIIVSEAAARGLNPFFVAGVIRQESLFQPAIQSASGATGLMQLMPITAREVAGSLGVPYSSDALIDPLTNVRFGTTYLSAMLNRFGGRPEDALAAYNAGPTRAREWQRLPEYEDRAVFTEHIPFQETRNYVKLVQQYARIYAALYGCGNFEPCLGLPPSRINAFASVPGRPRDETFAGGM